MSGLVVLGELLGVVGYGGLGDLHWKLVKGGVSIL